MSEDKSTDSNSENKPPESKGRGIARLVAKFVVNAATNLFNKIRGCFASSPYRTRFVICLAGVLIAAPINEAVDDEDSIVFIIATVIGVLSTLGLVAIVLGLILRGLVSFKSYGSLLLFLFVASCVSFLISFASTDAESPDIGVVFIFGSLFSISFVSVGIVWGIISFFRWIGDATEVVTENFKMVTMGALIAATVGILIAHGIEHIGKIVASKIIYSTLDEENTVRKFILSERVIEIRFENGDGVPVVIQTVRFDSASNPIRIALPFCAPHSAPNVDCAPVGD